MSTNSVLKGKSLGILMHPSSLPGGSNSGTFGIEAISWIKNLSKHGIKYWQFCLFSYRLYWSPYSSPSSFALNPWFLDINELIQKSSLLRLMKTSLAKGIRKKLFDFDLADNSSKELGKLLFYSWEKQSEQIKSEFYEWIKKILG